ncbi:MAG: phage tail tape measure protein, partial [Candidatus Asgardarchaeum californiense]
AFHGGGPYLGRDTTRTTADFDNAARMNRLQQQALTKTMMGVKEGDNKILDSSSVLGTGLHSKIEKYMKGIYGDKAEFEKAIEVQDEEIGTITGHIDAVLKEGDQYKKVIDVKTVSKSRVKDIDTAIKKAGSAKYEDVKGQVTDYESRRKLEEVASQLNIYLKALGTDMEAEAHFYNRFKPEEGPTVVKFKFDPERYKRDINNVKKARESILKSGGQFAKTASLDELRKAKPEELTGAEESYLVSAGKAYFIDAIKEANASSGRGKGSDPKKEEKRADTYFDKLSEKVRAINGERIVDRQEILNPPSVTPGVGYAVEYENLKKLHAYSKTYQQQGGIELSKYGMKEMNPEISDALSKIPESGPTGPEFSQLIDRLKETRSIKGDEVFKAWKLYKIATGDFYLKEMAKAQKEAEEFSKTGQYSKEQEAYSTFRKRLSQMQGYVKQNLGKPTDIYTEHRRYLQPGLAQGAGVYASPEEIIKSSTGPLGEDIGLMKTFTKLTGDLKGGKKMATPIDKAREALRSMGNLDKGMVDLLTDAEQLKRVGPEILEAWDFDKVVADISRLREALQLFSKANLTEDYNAPQQKNLALTIKLLSNVENQFSSITKRSKDFSGEWGDMGLLPVPKFETPKIQTAMHERNIQRVRKYFERPEDDGGPKVGERFTYTRKVMDDLGNVVTNTAIDFKKQGDAVDKLGTKYGVFSEKQRDLIEFGQGYNRTMRSAVGRAARWGAASAVVYGGFKKLTDAVKLMGDVETSMAGIRMVMNTSTTDFGKMEKSAVDMAKSYGVPVQEILSGMRVFAQQGLEQGDVLDRTRTATLASNVTTLSAKDATEALTAATKVYGKEGQSTVRFLDSWSEVESRHAITAGDMADAIKKSASAAKNAGFTFDQLNGIIAAIGSTTRQSGKEVGTSMRFIFRRLTSEKAPKELANIGIPVVTGTGELRKGFDVLDDLSKKWDVLTQAQKMNIAQAIGGTRQYNSLLVLMDNWSEALGAIEHSTDSKGSAERRNMEIMKTYQKQLEQVKQTAAETSIQFGKIFLPVAKVGLKGIKGFLEVINSIPSS